MLSAVFASIVVVVLLSAPILAWSRALPGRARGWVALAVVGHVAAALAMVWITREYYGYGDMLAYHRVGARLADAMRSNFTFYAPQVLNLVFQQETSLGEIHGAGWSTGTMHGISALACFVVANSLTAACLLVSLVALTGKLALYSALRAVFPEEYRPRIAIACLFLPSFVFWTGGILKEAVAIAGLGWMFWGLVRAYGMLRGRVLGVLMLGIGALAVGLTKPYILFPFAVAAGTAYYWRRSLARSGTVALAERPLRLLLALAITIAAMSALGALFPKYSTENLVQEAAHLRELGLSHAGGSTIEVDAPASSGVAGTLLYAPIAVVTALFRPFLFEVRNPLMLLSAFETTFLLVMFARSLFRRGVLASWRVMRAHPVLMFCLIFTLAFAVAVGISTTNLGSLSRYRTPMLPFWSTLLFVVAPLPKHLAARAAAHRGRFAAIRVVRARRPVSGAP